jgi:hypothetical protein
MPPTKRAARQIPRQLDEDEDEATPPSPPPTAAANGDDDDDDENIKPSDFIRRGHSAARQVADSTSSFAQAFRLTENIQIIKFLEDDPYANFTRHWIDRKSPTGTVRRSFTCMKNFRKECPLCEGGDKPTSVSAYNIALIGDDGVPILKTLDAGPKILNIIENYARDPKVAPISRGYFLASKSGKMGTVNYQFVPIKPHSLEEDYDITPPSAEELQALGLYDADNAVPVPKMKDLEAIALEIADEY